MTISNVFLLKLKDLKRQLHAERKRGEKLQQRLQEVLSDTHGRGKFVMLNFLLKIYDTSFFSHLHQLLFIST